MSGDSRTVDARQFVTDAKQILSSDEYQNFVSALQTLRVTCGHEGEDIDKVHDLMNSVVQLFNAPERVQLLHNFVAFVPPKHQPMYLELVNLVVRNRHDGAAQLAEMEASAKRQAMADKAVMIVHREIKPPPGAPKAEVVSSLGDQKYSTAQTAPSFSFGTCPRGRQHKQTYVDFHTGMRVNNIEDMPGARGADAMPGPNNYNVRNDMGNNALGHKGSRAATHTFGTDEARHNKLYISQYHSHIEKVGGKAEYFPGPGAHKEAPSSCGPAQVLSLKKNEPAFSFKRGAPTGREVPIVQQRYETPQAGGARAKRANYVLGEAIRSKDMYKPKPAELPGPEDPEMQRDPESAALAVRNKAPQFSLPRNPRTSPFYKREQQPYTAPQEALMQGTQSPGPRYFPDPNTKESTKETASSFTFGVSGTSRDSYLPSQARSRKKGGVCDIHESVLARKKGEKGTESVQKVRSCVGGHFQSKDKTEASFSFGNSRRRHFADQRGNPISAESAGIGNRKAVSLYGAKWA